MGATPDPAALRARNADQILEEARRVQQFAGHVIARVEAGHPEATAMYAADIVAAGQRMMTACATIQGIDIAADETSKEAENR